MAIHAIHFHRVARLAVKIAVAVIVLREMAILAVHAFFEVNVAEMNRFLELVLVVGRHHVVFRVQQVALAIALVDGAKHPAVAVEIGELSVLELLVEFRRADLFQKIEILPFPARGCAFRIREPGLVALLIGGIVLLRRIHVLAIGLVVPPDVAEIRRHHVRAGMNVADDALAGGNGARELVLDGMAGFVASGWWDRSGAVRLIAVSGVRAGMNRRSIVGINHVAGGAAAVPIIARMIVGAGQRKDRIEQARFLQAQENRVGAQLGAESAFAQLDVRPAGIFFGIRIADFRSLAAASLENAQNISGLETSQRASGSRCGSIPLARVCSCDGGGKVLMRCGSPSGE